MVRIVELLVSAVVGCYEGHVAAAAAASRAEQAIQRHSLPFFALRSTHGFNIRRVNFFWFP